MVPRWGWAGLTALAVVFSGCMAVDPSTPATNDTVDMEPALGPAVVIADISGGVNPYHEAFRRAAWTAHPATRIPGFPANATALDLTFSLATHEEAVAADRAVWDTYQERTLYWIPGTNLLLYTDDAFESNPSGAGYHEHGLGTAGAINAACPDCYILVVQDAESMSGDIIKQMADEMPWVDFGVSTSPYGPGYNPPTGMPPYRQATQAFHDAGRLFVSFSGNSVVSGFVNVGSPFFIPDWSYPPWVVMVGGAHEDCHSNDVLAGQPPEFVNDFTQELAWGTRNDEVATVSGTSFATPAVAGTFGRALLQIRQALGHNATGPELWRGEAHGSGILSDGALTQEELREAFSHVARHFSTLDYQPACGNFSGVPVSPAPWLEMGWGFIGPAEADALVAHLLDDTPLPDRHPGAEAWMCAFHHVRLAGTGYFSTDPCGPHDPPAPAAAPGTRPRTVISAPWDGLT